eukprot:353698-Chlamydomonas_euryale.AAC.4
MCRCRSLEAYHACRAKIGPKPRTCMHVNARGQRTRGIYVHACLRPWVGRGRGRRDRLRSEAESSMVCAWMTLPRFHIRVNARTGP